MGDQLLMAVLRHPDTALTNLQQVQQHIKAESIELYQLCYLSSALPCNLLLFEIQICSVAKYSVA